MNRGQTYQGEWKEGVPHGKGAFIQVDGFRYEGEVSQGKPHGFGKQVDSSGQTYEGQIEPLPHHIKKAHEG